MPARSSPGIPASCRTYHFFNSSISCNILLPELVESATKDSDIQVAVYTEEFYSEVSLVWFHDWKNYGEDIAIFSIAKLPEGYLFRVFGVADFEILNNGSVINCYMAETVPLDVIRHLLLDHVLTRVIGQQGALVLHASAVKLQSGKAVVFVGESGFGKSTIASSFSKNEGVLLSDDCIKLDGTDNAVVAVPSYSGCRLWPDSAQNLYSDKLATFEVVAKTDKLRLIDHVRSSHSSDVEVAAFFILSDPKLCQDGQIEVRKIEGANTLIKMISKSFLLDLTDMQAVAKQFSAVSKLATAFPPVFELAYPRSYSVLPKVRERILAHI